MIQEQKAQHQKIEAFKITFSNDVSTILQPGNVAGKRLINYFQRLKTQLNIRDFEVEEVINEATIRGLDSIERKGEAINNVSAWLNSIGTKVIKDQVKAEIKDRKLAQKQSHCTETSDSWITLALVEEGEAVRKAIKLLSPEDQEILKFRFTQEMDYKAIQAHYLEKKGISVKVPTLRKRESRAAKRLQTKFREIYE